MSTDACTSGSTYQAAVPRRSGTRYDPGLLGGGALVPYVAAWSSETTLSTRVVNGMSGGIAYADESLVDRDEWGVLWARTASRIGVGRPLFTDMHPLRQRRSMLRLLCQVCGQPADWNECGHLWLVAKPVTAPPDWPEGAPVTLPPVCVACARASVRMCPALRSGYSAVRAHSTVCGVTGVLFRPGHPFPRLAPSDADDGVVFYFGDPAIRWVMATHRARSLHDCVDVDLDRLVP